MMLLHHSRRLIGAIAIAVILTGASLRAAILPPGFIETQVGNTIARPTAMDFSPDGRLFVCQQTGQLRIIKNGALLTNPFVSLTVDSLGERGLLGIAFDPNFASNQFVYLYYTVPGTPAHNRVSRFTAAGDVAVIGSETVILELNSLSSATNHNGGAIHFGPDGKLYVAVGENANAANAQVITNRLGKILRINANGSIPADNPTSFSGIPGTPTNENRAIWAVGLRNPFTFGFQPGTGRLFINDVGEGTWEEINDGIAGSNYGWNLCEGFCSPSNPNLRDPLFEYGHGSPGNTTGCAIVGGAFYNPAINQFPASYTGKYFFGDLCSGWIRLFNPSNNTASAFATGISTLVDLKVGPEGSLYYLAQGNGGRVFKISVTSNSLNISSRSHVETGENVMIGGFIVAGSADKRVIVRAIGPSLPQFVPNPLTNPVLELHGPTGALIASNDNWRDSQETEIIQSQLAPTNDLESAIIATLAPGSYTGIVQGNNGGSGAGLVEVYDLDTAAASTLGNISTRSFVQTGDDRLIGGFILGSNGGGAQVIVRAIGPSLAQLSNTLADPTLELRDGNGGLIRFDDNWQDDQNQAAQITASGLAPTNPLESAISATLLPGNYTAIVSGKNGGTGIGVVEIYTNP